MRGIQIQRDNEKAGSECQNKGKKQGWPQTKSKHISASLVFLSFRDEKQNISNFFFVCLGVFLSDEMFISKSVK